MPFWVSVDSAVEPVKDVDRSTLASCVFDGVVQLDVHKLGFWGGYPSVLGVLGRGGLFSLIGLGLEMA